MSVQFSYVHRCKKNVSGKIKKALKYRKNVGRIKNVDHNLFTFLPIAVSAVPGIIV